MSRLTDIITDLGKLFVPQPEDYQTRSDFPSLEESLAALQRKPRPWRPASIHEALGVPSIFGAVSLIANTVGTLSLEAFQLGQRITDRQAVPRLIVRPNPFSTPYDFFRDTAFYRATRGEFWWWVAARDIDDSALSLYPVPPWEVTVEANDRNRLLPKIQWAGRDMPNRDMIHSMYLPDSSGLRGMGPLQACGAAASVAVEAQEWAANFYAGNLPSLLFETDQDMSEDELKALKAQWLEEPNANLPRFVTNGLKAHDLPIDPAKGQVMESRQYQVGETARMFSMPGALIEYQMSGSSLTYQNQEGIWADFQRRCLSPHYLEPIEQEISDLLTRATVARFNTSQLLRADISTRFTVYSAGIAAGIFGPEYAQAAEGITAGNVDFSPVPMAPPQAIPTILPINQLRSASDEWRCAKCDRKLAEVEGAGTQIRCRCGTLNTGAALQTRSEDNGNHELATAIMALATREQPVQAPNSMTIAEGAIQVHTPDVQVPVTIEGNEPIPIRRVRRTVERDDNNLIAAIVDTEE